MFHNWRLRFEGQQHEVCVILWNTWGLTVDMPRNWSFTSTKYQVSRCHAPTVPQAFAGENRNARNCAQTESHVVSHMIRRHACGMRTVAGRGHALQLGPCRATTRNCNKYMYQVPQSFPVSSDQKLGYATMEHIGVYRVEGFRVLRV